MKRIVMTLAALGLLGCSDPAEKTGDPWEVSNNATNNGTTSGSNNGATNNAACDGPAPGCGTCAAPSCENGSWTCLDTPCAPPDCDIDPSMPGCEQIETCQQDGSSDLPGVRFEFTGDRCSWALDEVAAGITIPYRLVIEEAIDVAAAPAQSGCEQLGPGNLKVGFRISGGDQLYCLCDQGLCPGGSEMVTLEPGTYDFEIEWSGLNWTGPSDTGNPMGEPFPAGEYEVEVVSGGTVNDAEFQVSQFMPITLLE